MSKIKNALCVLFAFLGAYGTSMSFVSCFSFGKENSFYLFPILLTVLICSGFLVDKIFRKEMLAIAVGLIGYIVIKFKDIVGSFVTAANLVIDDVNRSYNMGFSRIGYPDFVEEYIERELVLVLLVVVISVLISFFVMGYANVVGSMLVSVPFTVFGIFFDLFPKLSFLVMAALFWIVSVVLMISGHKGRQRPKAAMFNALTVSVMVGFSVLLSQIYMPESSYNKAAAMEEIKTRINEGIVKAQEAVNKLAESEIFDVELPQIEGFGDVSNGGGVGHGKFGNKDSIVFSGSKVLEVKMPLIDENLYLRAVVYNDYTGNSWGNDFAAYNERFGDKYVNTVNWPANLTCSTVANIRNDLYGIYGVGGREFFEDTNNYNVQVTNISEKGYSFAPYGAYFDESWDIEGDGLPKAGDVVSSNFSVCSAKDVGEFLKVYDHNKVIEYMMNNPGAVRDVKGLSTLYDLVTTEQEYAHFVKKEYTNVPSELSNVLLKYAPEEVPGDYDSIMSFVQDVRNLFNSEFAYTLSPGKVPAGQDGVRYFLEESKKGYCVYFASAATLMFRQAGIPARYVEGYVVTPDMARINRKEPGEIMWYLGDEAFSQEITYVTVTVPDNKAHAWVEVYIDGYGWVPVEVTPGYTLAVQAESKADDEAEEETTTREEETTTKADSEDKPEEKNIKIDWEELQKKFVIICGIIALAAVFVFGANKWYQAGRERLKLIIEGGNISGKKRAALCWWYINAIMKFLRKPIPENISYEAKIHFLRENTEFFSKSDFNGTIEYILKAYYGNEDLTNEELTSIGEMAVGFRTATYEELSDVQKFCFKYIRRL